MVWGLCTLDQRSQVQVRVHSKVASGGLCNFIFVCVGVFAFFLFGTSLSVYPRVIENNDKQQAGLIYRYTNTETKIRRFIPFLRSYCG